MPSNCEDTCDMVWNPVSCSVWYKLHELSLDKRVREQLRQLPQQSNSLNYVFISATLEVGKEVKFCLLGKAEFQYPNKIV